MSTKIYYAYKFDGKPNEIVNELRELRNVMIKKTKKEFPYLEGKDKELLVDFEIDAVVYFHKDNVYVQFFGAYGAMSRVGKTLNKRFSDFHYQDQVDQSNYDWDKEKWEDMTEERQNGLDDEWSKRKEVWEEIFIDYLAPAKVGLSYEIIESFDLFN